MERKTALDYAAEIEAKYGSSSSTDTSTENIQKQLDEINNSLSELQSSIDALETKETEATVEIPVEVPTQSNVFPYQQAVVFSLAGMLLGILLSFLVFRKMVKKIKKDYESRLSEARDSLERMIKIMSEKQ